MILGRVAFLCRAKESIPSPYPPMSRVYLSWSRRSLPLYWQTKALLQNDLGRNSSPGYAEVRGRDRVYSLVAQQPMGWSQVQPKEPAMFAERWERQRSNRFRDGVRERREPLEIRRWWHFPREPQGSEGSLWMRAKPNGRPPWPASKRESGCSSFSGQ